MDEIKSIKGFARELDKLDELPAADRLRVLCWLESKVQDMVRADTSKQAGPT